MNKLIEVKNVVAVIKSFMDINAGDEASEDLILAIGAELLDVSSDTMNEMVFDDNNSDSKPTVKVLGATLLSKEEAETFLTKEERVYKNWWWLRSPYNFHFACVVYYDGLSNYNCSVHDARGDIRPALKIDISNSDIKVGDVFEFGGKEFKVISPELAWMHREDIGRCAFRKEWKADDAHVYEHSDVKMFVDAWLNTALKEE